MDFQFFDRDEPVSVAHRKLPHWYQPDVATFITFRTIDSLPREVLDHWYAERDDWLCRHGIDPAADDRSDDLFALSPAQQAEFHCRFSAEYHQSLDRGYGECLLRKPDLARIVADSLLHFDGMRYHVSDFVIMPNHVHLIAAFLGDTTVTVQCRSWKRFTANKIHRALSRRGHFWQPESFDHLIRSPEQFVYLRQYIAANPRKAGLSDGEFIYYRTED